VNLAGYSIEKTTESKTLLGRFRSLRDRYHTRTAVALAVLAIVALTVAEVIPTVQDYVLRSGLIQYLILIVLLDLTVIIHHSQRPATASLAKNQDETMQKLIEALPRCRTDGVDLLEYAGATTLPLIRAIQREGVPMRMLVQHPDTIEGLQRQRNITTIDTVYNSIFANDKRSSLEIRCYRLPYSLRARRLGKVVLELGWLTPDIEGRTAYGHGNPSVLADLSTSQNEHLLVFFNRTFNDLWNDARTEDGRSVLNRSLTASHG
jgi:hypothetical protein